MKKILITGANSYIGVSFERYIKENFPGEYTVDTLDMLYDDWRGTSFADYDCVYHVAGIAHQKETAQNRRSYYEVNRNLAVEVACKAKSDGARQFIFLSTMSVYGMHSGVVTRETAPSPKSHYGASKWQAEQGITPLEDSGFKVCILRPPMVYGKGCKGNFNSLCKLVKKLPFFPWVKNRRSMIYIDNLSSFVRMCIDKELSGVYFPQNREYVSTVDMAKAIASAMGKKIRFEYLSGLAVCILRLFYPAAKKGFGSLIYLDTEEFDFCYVVKNNKQSYIDSVS